MCGYLLDNYILQGFNWKKIASLLGIYLGCVLATMFVWGAFHESPTVSGVLYSLSSNINSLFNSFGAYSRFLPGLPVGNKQYEGFAYLGAGMLLLVVVAIGLQIASRAIHKKKPSAKSAANKKGHKQHKQSTQDLAHPAIEKSYLIGCLAFVAITFFLLSVGPADNSRARFIVGVDQLVKMFRSHGRFIWCTMYVIMLGAIGCITNKLSLRAGMALICCCVALQIVDLSGRMREISSSFGEVVTYEPKAIASEKWESMAKAYRHFVILPYDGKIARNLDEIYEFAAFASKHDMTLNQMYFAVPYEASYERADESYRKQLADGTVSDDELFIFEDNVLQNTELKLYLYTLDGFTIGSKNEIVNLSIYEEG